MKVFVLLLLSFAGMAVTATVHVAAAEEAYRKGVVEAQAGDRKQAAIDLGRAIEIEPTYLDSYEALAHAQIADGQLNEAGRTLTRLLQIEPRNDIARLLLGNLLLNSHEDMRALAQFSITLTRNAGDADALFGFAKAAEALGMKDRVLSAMARGRKDFPADPRFAAE